MALRFCDGFDHYATADITKKWDLVNACSINGAYGRFGTPGLYVNYYMYKVFDNQATWIVGMGFQPNAWVNNVPDVSIIDNGTCQVDLRYDNNHRFYVTRNGTTLGSGSMVLRSPHWYYIELKVLIDNTNGGVWLRINGQDEIRLGAYALTPTSLDTQATANAYANQIWLGSGASANYLCDDLYICDATGSRNNDFLGDVRVQTILPSADGGTNEWTASAGSRWECVDDPTPDSVTDYISEDTAGQKNTFAFGNVTPTSGTVKGTQILIAARKDDAGSRFIAPVYGNGTPASDVDGATVSVGDSYIYYSEIKEQDPVAAADWTIASVNAAEFGVRLVS